jgi:glyoxylase-like metal-dependent hydrolase (beta-lactamase superfamily II)
MILETIVVGALGVNCFVLGDPETKDGVVVDPGADVANILAVVQRHGLTVRQVLNTHGHFDHVGGNRQMLEETGARLMIHEADVPYLAKVAMVAHMYGLQADDSPSPDQYLTDGQRITFGNCVIEVLHTPGHTPGGCCLYLPAEETVITGDTLFADSVGRTDLPGGSHETLIHAIREKLLPLPEQTIVRPGHGPTTTVGQEKRGNPYLR